MGNLNDWKGELIIMKVADLMNPSVVTIAPEESAALAARLISRHNVGSLPVCGGDGRLRGIVTDRDIVLRCVAPEEDPAQTPVRDIMTRNCAVVSPEDDPAAAARMMAESQVRRLPVTREGKLVGVLSLADLARAGQFSMEAAQALSEISDNVCPPKRHTKPVVPRSRAEAAARRHRDG